MTIFPNGCHTANPFNPSERYKGKSYCSIGEKKFCYSILIEWGYSSVTSGYCLPSHFPPSVRKLFFLFHALREANKKDFQNWCIFRAQNNWDTELNMHFKVYNSSTCALKRVYWVRNVLKVKLHLFFIFTLTCAWYVSHMDFIRIC